MIIDLQKLELVVSQRDELQRWLDAHAPYANNEQKQLDGGTSERAYWHHGYKSALTDIINLLTESSRLTYTVGTLN